MLDALVGPDDRGEGFVGVETEGSGRGVVEGV